jgi:hypothetical protein
MNCEASHNGFRCTLHKGHKGSHYDSVKDKSYSEVLMALEALHHALSLYSIEVDGWEVYSRDPELGGGWCVQELPSRPWSEVTVFSNLEEVAAFLQEQREAS